MVNLGGNNDTDMVNSSEIPQKLLQLVNTYNNRKSAWGVCCGMWSRCLEKLNISNTFSAHDTHPPCKQQDANKLCNLMDLHTDEEGGQYQWWWLQTTSHMPKGHGVTGELVIFCIAPLMHQITLIKACATYKCTLPISSENCQRNMRKYHSVWNMKRCKMT